MRRAKVQTIVSVAAVYGVLVMGCNAFGLGEDEGNEVRVTVTAVAAAALSGNDGNVYRVDSNTEFEGLNSLADVQVGDVVEIEWEAISASSDRLALEIEAGDHDDNGDDDD
jgi:hypothetical protein